MPKNNAIIEAFNRGRISPLGLSRIDLENTRLYAEEYTNWMPRSLGSMMLRPGWQYIDSTLSNNYTLHIPFVFSTTDTAIVELTANNMRVRVDEDVISRPSVSTAVTNGSFDTNLTGWTDADEAGATSAFATGGYMSLTGTGFLKAIRTQLVSVSSADEEKEHAVNIVIDRGPVLLRIGTTSGGQEYIAETSLDPGHHSLAFTPQGSFYIWLAASQKYAVRVDSVSIASSGDMVLTTPWTESDLDMIRHSQSGDIIFIACNGQRQRKIERRGPRSWSVVKYLAEDGPFRNQNSNPSKAITPSAISGNITLTAASPVFSSEHVGALFRMESQGQVVEVDVTAENQFSSSIRITGTGNERRFDITRAGTWSANVYVQRSYDDSSWVNAYGPYTTNATATIDDNLDNQIVYYRIGVPTGDFTSGTAELSMEFSGGSISGIVRVTDYTSSTSVSAEALRDLGSTSATVYWEEGSWSDYRGWPSAVALYEARLFWAGKDKIWASETDSFYDFDSEAEGDAGPINRSIGEGPVDTISWLLPMQRMIVGGQSAEWSVKSTTFDEPLTPGNFNIKSPSTQGSFPAAAVKVDNRGIFIQRSRKRMYEILYDIDANDYVSQDLTTLCPEMGTENFVKIAVQRQPDTRIHAVRGDGTVAVLLRDPVENVRCWVDVETDGEVEDITVLPGDGEDKVYYTVKRNINNQDVRYFERWALESECQGGTLNKQADSFLLYSGSAVTTITGLSHLEGEEVVVWGDGADLGTYTVSSSQITGLSASVSEAVVGLPYTARWKSGKLAYASGLGTAITQVKRVPQIGLNLRNTHKDGLKYGSDFNTLYSLPAVENGVTTDADYVWESYDEEMFQFDGSWDTDSRVCLQAAAPRPCTVTALIMQVVTNDKG